MLSNRHVLSAIPLTLLLASVAACGDDGAVQTPDAPVAPMPDAPAPPMPDAPDPVPTACETLGVTPAPIAVDAAWYGMNREKLTQYLDAAGCESPGFDVNERPIATFDWDNTISKNDFGDAITFYMIANNKVLQPTNQDWQETSRWMTPAGIAALSTACGTTVLAGEALPTSTNTACADEMLEMYINNKTVGGLTAFAGHNYRWMEPTYAWTAQLLAGYTHAQLQTFMTAAVTPQLAAAPGTTQTIGTHTGLNAYLRIYTQTKDVIAAAKSRGFDVWIITASPQDAIAAMSPMVGVDPDHVVGIRSKLDMNQKLTYKFEGCGTVGDDQQDMISYIQGKRCWINKVIFGDTTPIAMQPRNFGSRQVFAAGDSDTDAEFLRDATYRLVLNRNKKEIMCLAYYNEGGTWLVNPMFLQPKAMQTALYPCSTTACKNEGGTGGPCRDSGGNIIPDQVDSVFVP